MYYVNTNLQIYMKMYVIVVRIRTLSLCIWTGYGMYKIFDGTRTSLYMY